MAKTVLVQGVANGITFYFFSVQVENERKINQFIAQLKYFNLWLSYEYRKRKLILCIM